LLQGHTVVDGHEGYVAAVDDLQAGLVGVDAGPGIPPPGAGLPGGGGPDGSGSESGTGPVGYGGVEGGTDDADVEGERRV